MAFKSIFKTKSLVPKITRISSSIFGGRRPTDAPLLTPSGTPVSETLVETNNILQEIQKQLALDFAYRIAKEEDEIKNIRKTTATMKGGKIGGGEKGTKLGGAIGKVFQTVTAPVRGIFSRILGFFGWLAAGFVVNKGLKWLSDNPEKIDKITNAITKHWGLIAGLVIGGVIFSTVNNLLGAVFLLRTGFNILRTIGGLPFRGRTPGGGTPGGGNLKKGLSNKELSNLNRSHGKNIAGTANIGDKARLLRHGFIKPPAIISKFLNKTKGVRAKIPGGGSVGPILRTVDGIFNYVERMQSGQSQQKAISGTGARVLGTGLGWKGGALVGTAIGGPGIGTLIGAIIGSVGTSMLFENVMDKVSDSIGWGGNKLSHGEINNHENLFHNRMEGSENTTVIYEKPEYESPPSGGDSSNVANQPSTVPADDSSNPNIKWMKGKLEIYL